MYTVVQNLTQFRLPTSLSNGKRRGGAATVIGFLFFHILNYLTLWIKIMGRRKA